MPLAARKNVAKSGTHLRKSRSQAYQWLGLIIFASIASMHWIKNAVKRPRPILLFRLRSFSVTPIDPSFSASCPYVTPRGFNSPFKRFFAFVSNACVTGLLFHSLTGTSARSKIIISDDINPCIRLRLYPYLMLNIIGYIDVEQHFLLSSMLQKSRAMYSCRR
jgi:hypothetical protein